MFRLVPSAPGAVAVEVMPDNVHSTYLSIGEGGWIEVFTSPKNSQRGVDDTLEIVATAVAGRVRERVWRRKNTGERAGSLLYMQLQPEGRWRVIGTDDSPAPFLRSRRYDEAMIEYEPDRS